MHQGVVVAADTRPRQLGGLRLEVEQLAELPAFPVQPRIAPGTFFERRAEMGEHGERDAAVAGDVLLAGEIRRQRARIAFLQQVQRQLRIDALPEEVLAHRRPPQAAAIQPVQPRHQAPDAMDEQQ